MKLVIIESPYAGDIEKNIHYAKECMKDSLRRGESPLASHLIYTQEGILDDTIREERKFGIKAGLEWKRVADLQVFYLDNGWSNGMKEAYEKSKTGSVPVEIRYLYKIIKNHFKITGAWKSEGTH